MDYISLAKRGSSEPAGDDHRKPQGNDATTEPAPLDTIPRLPWQLERLVNAASSGLLPDGAVQLPESLTSDLNSYVLTWSATYLTTSDREHCLSRLWAAYRAWRPGRVN